MKSFLKFLSESAAQQAARLGLEGDGHGGWYKDGEFVAKTEKGTLKFYNKRQKIGAKDPAQTEKEKNISDPNFVDPNLQQEPAPQAPAPQVEPAAQEPEQPVGPPPVEKTKGTLTVAFGRFNPPTIGHQQLMDVAAQAASGDDGGEYLIFPSRSQDKKKNPLDPDTKIEYMQKFYPAHADKIMNDANTRTIFDVLKMAHNDGYTNVRIVGGSDRVKEFEKLSNNYNGQLYAFDNIEVLSSGERDPDAKGVEGMSASRMRLAAAEGDFNKFREGLPSDLKRSEAKELFDVLRGAMQVKEGWNVWEIAPKFDFRTLREKYIKKSIFNLGEKVQNLNTGLVGEISRRGTNYLICVTESGQMFKSWIRDLVEYKEQKVTEISGVPADQRLVGTDAHRKYVETMVPGHDWGKQFINKYRKK
jgi:nicotinamide mononucleotide adenylyltransferase